MSSSKNKIKEFCSDFLFQEELNSILSFITEFCDVSHAYISLIGINDVLIKAENNFKFSLIPDNLVTLNKEVIDQNKISIVTKATEYCPSSKANISFFPYAFFAGIPLCINESLVVGTLCIIDEKEKKLSLLQLKSLDSAVLQIKSLLELYIKNRELEYVIEEKKNQFEQFLYNSNEIFYELNMEGIFISASENWTRFLGHDLSDVIGKNCSDFIHVEDLEKCLIFFKNLSLYQKSLTELTYRILHKDGYYVWRSSHIKFVQRNGIKFYAGNCRDITDFVESQEKILVQKQFYEKILDQLPTDVAVFDNNFKYLYLNPAAIKDDQLRDFIVGKDDFEYADYTGRDNEFAKKRREKFIQAVNTKKIVEWEDPIRRKDGQLTYHSRKFAPVFRDDGSIEIMIGFGVDITESKIIQNEIVKSKQLANSVIQNVAVGILVQGPQSEVLEYNKAACEMLGVSEGQLLGKTSFDAHWRVIHLDGSDFISENHPVPQAIRQLKPINNIIMGVHRPLLNDLVWLMVDAIPVLGDANELLYVICSFNDITAQKIAEDALKVSNERFVLAGKATSEALWDWDIRTDEMYVGGSYSLLFGYQFDNDLTNGLQCGNLIHKDDFERYVVSSQEAIDGEALRWTSEYRFLKSDGTYAYVNDKAIIIRNDDGEAIRMIGAMQDITYEKKLKDELLQSEQQFKGAFENSSIGMAIVDNEGYWVNVNSRLCEILGYSKLEFKSLTFEELTYIEDLSADLANRDKLVLGEVSHFNMEKRYIHKNGSLIWVHLSVSVVKNEKGEILHFIPQIMDISERKKIEEKKKIIIEKSNINKENELKKAEYMYRLIAENTADIVCLHSLDSRFQYISPSITKLLGYNPKDLIGKLPQDIVHPEDIENLNQTIYSLLNVMEDVSLRLRFLDVEGNYFWFECNATLVIEAGIPISFRSSARDITERQKAEKIIENTLIQERELNELRTNLVSTISHEFRTPMTTIRTSAEMVTMYLDLEGEEFKNSIKIKKRVQTITEEIDRIVELMNAVLTISKDDSGKTNFNPVVLDLKKVCMDVINTSYNDRKDKRKVKTSFKGNSFTMFADKNLIEYSLFNILNNAFKYSEGFGEIFLNLFNCGNTIVLEIIDFGIGIPDEDQSKLFNTFFRASNTDGFQGTGLGLYIVKTFIEKNSGTVQLESKIGKGTKVTLSFPIQK